MSQTELNKLHQDAEDLVCRYIDRPRPDLKDLIMVQYSGLVERTARRFSGIEAYEDLVQVGYIGLLNALSKFDPTAGVRFNTYATYLVAGEIKHYLRDRAQTIRTPAWLQELRHKVNKSASALQHELQRVPTEREIAEHVGVSEAAIREVFQTQEILKVVSLDGAPQEDESGEVEQLDASAFCPEQLSVEDRVVLEHAMQQLRDLERQVLVLFHFQAMNQTEIAAQLGISCNYVSHILRQSLGKLRKILSNEEQRDRALRRHAPMADNEILDIGTGAYTEAYFKSRLEEELHRASAEEASVAIVMIQFHGLDAMRKFYGEQSVIDFLADATEFIRENVRRLDVVARFGDSGFGVILPSVGRGVDLVRKRLVSKVGEWISGRYGSGASTAVEIGSAIGPDSGKNARSLLASVEMTAIGEAGWLKSDAA